MGFKSFEALLSQYDAGPAEIKTFLGTGPILTDDQPLTEYFLSLPQNDKPVDFSTLRGSVWRHVIAAGHLDHGSLIGKRETPAGLLHDSNAVGLTVSNIESTGRIHEHSVRP